MHCLCYRGCWHRLGQYFLPLRNIIIPSTESAFTVYLPSSATNPHWVKLSPIAQDSPLLASSRSLDLISVPMWLAVLPNQLQIIC